MYPSTTIPIPPYPSVRLADFLIDEEIAWAHDGYIVAGVEGDYFEFIRVHLQGCLAGITILLFPFELKFSSRKFFSIFLLSNKICMLDFQPQPSEGEEEGEEEEEEEIPSPHHTGSSSSSFMET